MFYFHSINHVTDKVKYFKTFSVLFLMIMADS